MEKGISIHLNLTIQAGTIHTHCYYLMCHDINLGLLFRLSNIHAVAEDLLVAADST